MSDEFTRDDAHDAGGRAHTGTDEPHPAGDHPRSDRETGGPSSTEDAEPTDTAEEGPDTAA